MNMVDHIWRLPGRCVIGLVRLYQVAISPLIGPSCRFQPTCSEYMVLAIQKYGAMSGILRGLRRILRCHPWSPGGHDPP